MALDRRQAAREYKETPRTIGVGVVRNRQSGRALVFSGVDIPALVNRQRSQLRLGAHRNTTLQREWQDLGEAHFDIAIVDTLKPRDEAGYDPTADLAALEGLWIEKLGSVAPAGYNPAARR